MVVKLLTILFLTFCLQSNGQQRKFNTFKLIILKPDTVIIDKSLYSDRDSIVKAYNESYFRQVKLMEGLVNCVGCPHDSLKIEQWKNTLLFLKAKQSQILQFKYYDIISSSSVSVYYSDFDENEPFPEIIELPNQKVDIASLFKLADTSKADFIIYFRNIHTELKKGLPILKLTTSLYSKKENRILVTIETDGDANSRGDMGTCRSTVLACLLINAVGTSTDAIFPVIAKAQTRK